MLAQLPRGWSLPSWARAPTAPSPPAQCIQELSLAQTGLLPMEGTDASLSSLWPFLQQLGDTRGNMYVPIYQLSMSQSPREQTENKSVLCTSHYKAVGTFPPSAAPHHPAFGNLYQFPICCGLNKCLPSREGCAPLRGVALGRGGGGRRAESASFGGGTEPSATPVHSGLAETPGTACGRAVERALGRGQEAKDC